MSFNPLDWIVQGIQSAFDFLIGDFLNWLLGVQLESINALYSFNPIDLNADWWRSTYAFAFYFGFVASLILSGFKLISAFWHRDINGMGGAATLWMKVLIVGSFFPVVYGALLGISATLRDAAHLGMTPEQMYGHLDMYRGLGMWGGGIFVALLVPITVVTYIEVVVFQLLAFVIAALGGLAYGLKEAGGVGMWLWKKVLAFGFVSIFGAPVVILIQSLGFKVIQNVKLSPAMHSLNPEAVILTVFLGFAAYAPWGMMGAIKAPIETIVKGGRLQNSGKTQATMRKPSSSSKGLGRDVALLYGEHQLDLKAMSHASNLRRNGDPGAEVKARPRRPPGKGPSGGATVVATKAATAVHPLAGKTLAGAVAVKKATSGGQRGGKS